MKKQIHTILIALFLFFFMSGVHAQYSTLEQGFKNPPSEAKARTWWHWINGNVSKHGITADLEAMKEIGIQEAQIFSVSLGQLQGKATYLSPEWLEMLRFAAQEALRLDLDLTLHNCAGWSSSGGPWIRPEYAMQVTVFTDTILQGNQIFKGQLKQPLTRLDYYQDIAVLAFPRPAKELHIDGIDYKNLSARVRNHLAPDDKMISSSAIVHQADIIDLSHLMSSDGALEWQVPEGEWVLLRLGHTPTGTINRLPADGGKGLECDKMSREALDVFWQGGIEPIVEALDTLVGTAINNILIDSYEVGTNNWTTGFEQAFSRLRGYSCLSFLPTLAGYYVESGEQSERFLWDFRRTIGDLMAENYYAYFAEKCHNIGVNFSVEPYWGPFDNMQVGATGDIVMCEFWSGSLAFFDSPKFVASIAKLNGSKIVGAEAFTAMGGWTQHPAQLKSIGDMALAQGINRFIFHSFVHQPYDVPPGLTLGPFGIDFNRHNTWWKQSKGFLDYIARSQFLLQQGKTQADVLVFTGEASPNDALLMPEIKQMGYDYDLIGQNMLHTLTVKDGLIYTPLGNQYRYLVLPHSEWLSPEFLMKIEELANAGAAIFASKPRKSPSLKNYPQCDDLVEKYAASLWSSGLVQDESVIDVLKSGNIKPDFAIVNGNPAGISFIHRQVDQTDIYFVANAQKEHRELTCNFRVNGKSPELWNAETGTITDAAIWHNNTDGTSTVTFQLEAEGAVFVIFRNDALPAIVNAESKCRLSPATPLPELKIISAEYGTFLAPGLVDVTEAISGKIKAGVLEVDANRQLCNCDPAPGYHKELRVSYSIGGKTYAKKLKEKEHLTIASDGLGDLKINKAIFGKFERGVENLPADNKAVSVKGRIEEKLNQNIFEIKIDDDFLQGIKANAPQNKLRVIYESQGETYSKLWCKGEVLRLAQENPNDKIVKVDGNRYWVVPYPGELTYRTSSGKTKTIKVKSIPQPIDLSGAWTVDFPDVKKMTFDKLISWTESTDNDIHYFSGTACYTKQFEIPKKLMKENRLLELDLGKVQVISEVILNGKNLGVLWKKPFRINIDEAVKSGTNTLEVKVTNLWPNRLIGDEQLPLDYKRRGNNIKQFPEWIDDVSQRTSGRSTLPGYLHYRKDAELLSSGMLGPVLIRSYMKRDIK